MTLEDLSPLSTRRSVSRSVASLLANRKSKGSSVEYMNLRTQRRVANFSIESGVATRTARRCEGRAFSHYLSPSFRPGPPISLFQHHCSWALL